MPIYEYQCESCEKIHEVMQKFSDAPLSQCPECQAPVHKIMSRTSFALKGTGWYTSDYKRSSPPSSTNTPQPPAAPKTATAENSSTSAATAPAAKETVKTTNTTS